MILLTLVLVKIVYDSLMIVVSYMTGPFIYNGGFEKFLRSFIKFRPFYIIRSKFCSEHILTTYKYNLWAKFTTFSGI